VTEVSYDPGASGGGIVLEVVGLTKRYGSVVALDGAAFTAVPGRMKLRDAWRAGR
jgi:hypothetical protein